METRDDESEALARLMEVHLPQMDRLGGEWNEVARGYLGRPRRPEATETRVSTKSSSGPCQRNGGCQDETDEEFIARWIAAGRPQPAVDAIQAAIHDALPADTPPLISQPVIRPEPKENR